MEMLLTVLLLSVVGVMVSAALFAAAVRNTSVDQPVPSLEAAPTTASTFFAAPAPVAMARMPVSVDVLLLQIERHVRIEQAAAESFMAMPTVEMLHMPTASPLVH